MKTKQYKSFEDIDKQLKIYSLKKNIAHEQLKISLKETKNDLVPKNLMGSINHLGNAGMILQQFAITFITEKLVKKFKKRKSIH